ncbi:glutamate N-acetyltransferase [Recurvomyces mirabilis]|nr:glutamate N-acetyltransferase [Recurvomyces mirabilis]
MERMIARTPSGIKRLACKCSQIRHYSAPGDRSIPPAKQKYVPTSGTYPKGFLAGSSHAGVKASNTQHDDIALVVSDQPCVAAGIFTKNIFKAAPVQASLATLKQRQHSGVRGVVVNSGCANAVTGKVGLEHADAMAKEADRCFIDPEHSSSAQDSPQTLVMSTGVIGQQLPIEKITAAIPKAHSALGSTHDHWLDAAKAICTTDTFPKLISRTFTLPSHPGTEYRIAGMTKGAGMIHPNMATLLGIVCTDVSIDPKAITSILRHSANRSFNCISIDGDTSTNDTVTLFANGAATPKGVQPLTLPEDFIQKPRLGNRKLDHYKRSPDTIAFTEVFIAFMTDLAKLVVRDGEGATKFVTIRVISDVNAQVAKRAAMSIARSALVKTALYGKDANWGRILCAVGYAPGIMGSTELPSSSPHTGQVTPERTSVSFIPTDGSGVLELLVRGEPQAVDEVRAKQILEMEDLEILVRLEDGPDPARLGTLETAKTFESKVWTCDFSHDYVTINGDYRT